MRIIDTIPVLEEDTRRRVSSSSTGMVSIILIESSSFFGTRPLTPEPLVGSDYNRYRRKTKDKITALASSKSSRANPPCC